MAFTPLPPDADLELSANAAESMFIRLGKSRLVVTPKHNKYQFRGICYRPPGRGRNTPLEPHRYPICANQDGVPGWDPDWALLMALDDGSRIASSAFSARLVDSDPMVTYPDPHGPGAGLPLPFAILRCFPTPAKSMRLLVLISGSALAGAKLGGSNLGEYYLKNICNKSFSMVNHRHTSQDSALLMAAWLVARSSLTLSSASCAHTIIESGFFCGLESGAGVHSEGSTRMASALRKVMQVSKGENILALARDLLVRTSIGVIESLDQAAIFRANLPLTKPCAIQATIPALALIAWTLKPSPELEHLVRLAPVNLATQVIQSISRQSKSCESMGLVDFIRTRVVADSSQKARLESFFLSSRPRQSKVSGNRMRI